MRCLRTPEGRHPTEWTPPATNVPAQVIRGALSDLKLHMAPALKPEVAEQLARLQSLTVHRDAEQIDWKLRAMEYHRLLSHYPADIWRDAIDEWLQNPEQGKWFPTIADLTALMGKRMYERKLMIDRLEKMAKPRPANDFEPKEPREKRLRTVIDAWKGLSDDTMAKGVLGASARNAEIELAAIENRKPEEWATADGTN
jgi:hypothetical protein